MAIDLLGDRYAVADDNIGGGMCDVFLAKRLSDGLSVCVRMNSEYDEDATECFVSGTELQSALHLRNQQFFPEIFELVRHVNGECAVAVMELVLGENLNEVIDNYGPLPLQRAIKIFKQILIALNYVHASGSIHRDIKCGNVVVGLGDNIKLIDFDLWGMTGDVRDGLIGTEQYMSPEGWHYEIDLDERHDLYALGVLLYKMLSGRLPFLRNGRSMGALRDDHLYGPVPEITSVQIPDAIWVIIQKLLAKKREDRYQNCGEVLADLAKL